MRRIVTVGVFSVATMLYGACSDDGGDGGIGGNGGNGATGGAAGSGSGASAGQAGSAGAGNVAGSAGTAGQGGTAGSAGAGGSAGSAGAAGAAGLGGNDPDAGDSGVVETDGGLGDGGLGDASAGFPCTGCLELRAPLAAPNDNGYFQLVFSSRDLSDGVETFRLGALVFDETGQTLITPLATSFDGTAVYTQGNGTSIVNNAATFNSTFIDVQLNIGNIATANFDATKVIAVGIQLFAGGTYTGPAPTLILDSITFTGANAPTSLDFTTDAQTFAVNAGQSVAGTEIIHH